MKTKSILLEILIITTITLLGMWFLFVYKTNSITKPQAYHLTYRLAEWYENMMA